MATFSVEELLARAGSEAVGFGVGQALSNTLAPEATQLAQEAWRLDPALVSDPQTLATAVRLGHISFDDAAAEAEASGLNRERFQRLYAEQYAPPSTESILEMMRRRSLDDNGAIDALQRLGIEERYLPQYMALHRNLLQAADLALARQQGFIEQDEQRERSLLQGYAPEDADLLYELAGLPPGIGESIELLRRGEITDEYFAQIVREGHTKTKYTGDLLKLRWTPLSASIAAEALIRQRIGEDAAVKIAEENGIRKEDFLLWSNMLGRPIAIGESLTLARRGEFTFEQFRDAVARSDVRTEYADDLWKLRTVYPPLFQLVRLLANGSVTHERGVEIILKLGYTPELAHDIADAAGKDKTAGTRKIAATQIDELYEAGLETREWALDALTHYGYDEDQAGLHLQLIDAKRLVAALQSNVRLVERQYVARKIDEATAGQRLDDIGVLNPARDLLLERWGHERESTLLVLTNAQIGRALKLGAITVEQALARWTANGYVEADARILAFLAGHPEAGPNPTAP